jgi:hypothetical protein
LAVDRPRPPRELNPEVPEALSELVMSLLARIPAERPPSAEAVVKALQAIEAVERERSLLGHRPATPGGKETGRGRPSRGSSRRYRIVLALAATVLLTGLGLTGYHFGPAVIRIATNRGELVIETVDKDVEVAVKQNGELVEIIDLKTKQKIELRAGDYEVALSGKAEGLRLSANKFTLKRGGTKLVAIEWLKRDENVPPAEEAGAFVLLDSKGAAVRKVATLAEAVLAANDGDTIEVRGNGPFVSESVNLVKTALTIRAGEGFRPVIKLDPKDRDGSVGFGDRNNSGLLVSKAPLVLEGLEFQRVFRDPPKDGTWQVIIHSYAPLYVANCRFVSTQIHNCISAVSPVCELRNCEILGPDGSALIWSARQSGARLVIANCLNCAGQIVMGYDPDTRDIHLTGNTSVTIHGSLRLTVDLDNRQQIPNVDAQSKLLRVEASGNVFDESLVHLQLALFNVVTSAGGKNFLTERAGWQGQRNLFAGAGDYLHGSGKGLEAAKPIKSLANWKQFWGSAETGSIEGKVRYQGGNLLARLAAAPEKLTPEDFRLRPDSAGYRAGKDGKDLGADIDLVGPGKAYERWKKTPQYQEWLKETGQLPPNAGSPPRIKNGLGHGERTWFRGNQTASAGDSHHSNRRSFACT